MMTHPTDDELNDYHDGLLAAEARAAVDEHLARCVECEDRSALIAELLDQLHGVPRAIEPPAHVWTAIREVVDREKAAVIEKPAVIEEAPVIEGEPVAAIGESPVIEGEPAVIGDSSSGRGPAAAVGESSRGREPEAAIGERPAPRRPRAWLLVAASLLLIVASSAVARWAMNDTPADSDAAITRRLAGEASLARFVQLEAAYVHAANDLIEAIERERRTIPPDVAVRAQQSLLVIDEAVREVRSALADDPDNAALVDMALAAHRKKLELLEQVRQWSSES